MKSQPIMPFKVSELKAILEKLPDDADISYEHNGGLYWESSKKILYVSET